MSKSVQPNLGEKGWQYKGTLKGYTPQGKVFHNKVTQQDHVAQSTQTANGKTTRLYDPATGKPQKGFAPIKSSVNLKEIKEPKGFFNWLLKKGPPPVEPNLGPGWQKLNQSDFGAELYANNLEKETYWVKSEQTPQGKVTRVYDQVSGSPVRSFAPAAEAKPLKKPNWFQRLISR
jgi:hypothetical protein